MRKITLIICAAMMIASTLRAQEVKSIEASIEDYIALLNQNGYQAYSFDISLMKDATYQIQFEVREYVAGNPEPVSAQPYCRGFKSRTMVSDFMWRELSEEELADIRDASVDYENGVYSRAEKITVGFLPCENDSTEVGRLFVENQGSSGFSLKLKHINCKTQFIDINPNEDIYIHNGVYANEAIFNKVAAEDPEAVIMVGYLKNDKEVRVVVTPSEVYVTGIVILREQKEDDPIKVNVRDAEGKEVPV